MNRSVMKRVAGVFLLLGPFLWADANAAEQSSDACSRPLDIHVMRRAIEGASVSDVTAVLKSAACQIWQYCPGIQLCGIDVYHESGHPHTSLQSISGGRVAVGLTARKTFWAQYSFQFAHEFCHVLANFSDHQKLIKRPGRANLWLEESICETASLFTLRAMARSWPAAAPYEEWKSYAPSFSEYITERLASPSQHLPAGKSFSAWFRENQGALRRKATLRDQNTIIALQLLPLFEAEPEGWKALAFLNRGNTDPKESLAGYLVHWRSESPVEIRPFINKLAAVFEVKLK